MMSPSGATDVSAWFFEDRDYALYRDWLGQSCQRFGVEIWAYKLGSPATGWNW